MQLKQQLFDLLFERFLNPERVSMPDIDMDFGDTRRGEVVDPSMGHGNPCLQYSSLKISMDGGARWATVHGVAKSQTQLSD